MKKYMYICLFCVLFVMTIVLISCGKKDKGMNEVFFKEFLMDDVKTLENSLTKEYDIKELRLFFEGSNINENAGLTSTTSRLLFSEVNRRYPVEILRTGGYSVYRVSQGGYFYVFWVKTFATDADQSNIEPAVYFTAYLSSDTSLKLFDSLTLGSSTAEDVKRIDSSFELCFLMSNGIFSYSFINDETLLEIEYECKENIDGYDDLVVKGKSIISRDSAPSRYSLILTIDLP